MENNLSKHMNPFNYWIEVKELIPQLGKNRFFAKVSRIYKAIEGENREIAVNHDFGETYGETRDEARQRMDQVVKSWIKKQ